MTGKAFSFVEKVRHMGMDTSLLYEAVIEVSDEGLLTAGAVNAAAAILVDELGLPEYFFRNISKSALKDVLRSIATHMQWRDGRFVLLSDVSEVRFDVYGGIRARVATEETRDRMEDMLAPVMSGYRIEYYFAPERHYHTYIIRPEKCKALDEIGEDGSRFAFARSGDYLDMPVETRERYESFLARAEASVTPLVEATLSEGTGETRIMFREDFQSSPLPAVRKVMHDLGLTLSRAYWETYRGRSGRVESICSLYVKGKPDSKPMQEGMDKLRVLLALPESNLVELYLADKLELEETAFAVNASAFVHAFVYKDLPSDREIMDSMPSEQLREAFAKRVYDTNVSEYTRKVVDDTIALRPDLVKRVFKLFDRRFNPRFKTRPSAKSVEKELADFRRRVAIEFLEDTTGHDIFSFVGRLVTDTLKTNFYAKRKRAFAFRLTRDALDPLVFAGKVHGMFFTVGFHSIGTHMRADDVARGGLRLLRVTPSNYETQLDYMPLLNYALGPVAQRLKHKDIAESGAKGVITPHVAYAKDGLRAVQDYTEGIMDLILPSSEVVDLLGKPEMIFFGPDEGTAPFMDAVALRAKDRGYKHWRTVTTGKSIGVPHDEYGRTKDGKVFGLLPRGADGTELLIDGEHALLTTDTAHIYERIGEDIHASGMTTTGVMACFRALIEKLGMKEEDVNLMMTGGPDGDLGANQIQTFKGRICMVIDGGGILFDPQGLDRRALVELAFARHTSPRLDSMAYTEDKLSGDGFKVPRTGGAMSLPGGLEIDDAALFHRNALTEPKLRPLVAKANITAFVPCGGFKDTVNARNVKEFIGLYRELRVIVEGANVFFDNAAREAIATETDIKQIKDSSANKGGVTSSSVAEVLTAFLLGDDYEKTLVENQTARAALIREVLDLIEQNAVAETRMLLTLKETEGKPLYRLSMETSEQLFAAQDKLAAGIEEVLARPKVVEDVLRAYIPPSLVKRLGMGKIVETFAQPELSAYRDAILTKKLASMALYKMADRWPNVLRAIDGDMAKALAMIL